MADITQWIQKGMDNLEKARQAVKDTIHRKGNIDQALYQLNSRIIELGHLNNNTKD